ncbi:MAG: M20/M25/M40 family metallo-hydrolase [Clostridia bacterium]
MEACLRAWTQLQGPSGDERPIAEAIRDAFVPYCQDVTIDAMQNVVARIGSQGPRVMITAHLDEIGLMATLVEKDGAIRFTRVGGVDPRILPGSRVIVRTETGDLPGVVGALPPHLLSMEMRKKNYTMDQLFVDVGLPPERVRERVMPGTQISLYGPTTRLENGSLASKTMDDRAGVAVMLRAAELLARREVRAQVFFVAAAQEEVGSQGAQTAAYRLDPDMGIAIDVTHGEIPGCAPDETHPLDEVVSTMGPVIHPRLHQYLLDTAKAEHVKVRESYCARDTWTDADVLQITRAGVPTVLVELPLKYMHTTVELLREETLQEAARLVAAFVAGLDAGWEDLLCY